MQCYHCFRHVKIFIISPMGRYFPGTRVSLDTLYPYLHTLTHTDVKKLITNPPAKAVSIFTQKPWKTLIGLSLRKIHHHQTESTNSILSMNALVHVPLCLTKSSLHCRQVTKHWGLTYQHCGNGRKNTEDK